LAFASRIAWRSDPRPVSLVLVTVKVAADAAAPASRNSVAPSARCFHGRMTDPQPAVRCGFPIICPPLPGRGPKLKVKNEARDARYALREVESLTRIGRLLMGGRTS